MASFLESMLPPTSAASFFGPSGARSVGVKDSKKPASDSFRPVLDVSESDADLFAVVDLEAVPGSGSPGRDGSESIGDSTPGTEKSFSFSSYDVKEPVSSWEVEIEKLLKYFATHRASKFSKSSSVVKDRALHISETLFSRDCELIVVDNSFGSICSSYPNKIFVPKSSYSEFSSFDSDSLKVAFQSSRFARVHGRFVVPVLLVSDRYMCRSSTLSIEVEAILKNVQAKTAHMLGFKEDGVTSLDLESQRRSDVKLLNKFKVKSICDLMVEKRKKAYGVYVTSSEKDKSRKPQYKSFNLNVIPYPGCEFFRKYKELDFNASKMFYDWRLDFIDAELELPFDPCLAIKWSDYKKWDLVTLTKNYLKLLCDSLLKREDHGGILIHCISGWDRTPMFVSLMRMLLWGEGLVHQSLSPEEMLYFTLAYDWLLFGHQFADRLDKGEDILRFCFEFLHHIAEDSDFSLSFLKRKLSASRLSDKGYVKAPGHLSICEDHFSMSLGKRSTDIPIPTVTKTASRPSMPPSSFTDSVSCSWEIVHNSLHDEMGRSLSSSRSNSLMGVSHEPECEFKEDFVVDHSEEHSRSLPRSSPGIMLSGSDFPFAFEDELAEKPSGLPSSTDFTDSLKVDSGDLIGKRFSFTGEFKSRSERLREVKRLFELVYERSIAPVTGKDSPKRRL